VKVEEQGGEVRQRRKTEMSGLLVSYAGRMERLDRWSFKVGVGVPLGIFPTRYVPACVHVTCSVDACLRRLLTLYLPPSKLDFFRTSKTSLAAPDTQIQIILSDAITSYASPKTPCL